MADMIGWISLAVSIVALLASIASVVHQERQWRASQRRYQRPL